MISRYNMCLGIMMYRIVECTVWITLHHHKIVVLFVKLI